MHAAAPGGGSSESEESGPADARAAERAQLDQTVGDGAGVRGALNGLLAVEISETPAAAYAGRLLAGMGADVLLVEPPGGTALRRRPQAALHLHLNRGKQSLRLNLRSAAARRILGELLAEADILLLDLERAEYAPRGLDPVALRESHPRLQVCTITPYGWSGPKADWCAAELTAYAAGGYLRIGGEPEREPLKAWGEQAHLQAGLHAALGVLAALHAQSCGQAAGQHVDTAIYEAVAFLLGGGYQHAWFHDREPLRNGPRLVGFGPGHLYPSTLRPCADGWVHAHCNNRYPEQMAVLFEEPRLAEPQLLAALMGHADEVDALMAPLLERLPRREVVRRAQELRLPFTEVLQPSEVLADADGHHASRGFFQPLAADGGAAVLAPGAAVRFGAGAWRDGEAPRLDSAAASTAESAADNAANSAVNSAVKRLGGPRERVRWRRAGVT